MDDAVGKLFARYESLFNQALAGSAPMEEVAQLYAPEFIGAGPAGVRAGRNDAPFLQVMAQGYDRYRQTGAKSFRITGLRITPIDDLHCLAHVTWTATYARKSLLDAVLDFQVHYLVQVLQGEAKVFGWIAGDEEALLRQHGIA